VKTESDVPIIQNDTQKCREKGKKINGYIEVRGMPHDMALNKVQYSESDPSFA
jgi:hypothetical protein